MARPSPGFPGPAKGESTRLGRNWIVFHDPFQLLHPRSKVVRNTSAAPPAEPFEGLIDLQLAQAVTKGIPSHIRRGLCTICIEVRPPQRQSLLLRPMPRSKASQRSE